MVVEYLHLRARRAKTPVSSHLFHSPAISTGGHQSALAANHNYKPPPMTSRTSTQSIARSGASQLVNAFAPLFQGFLPPSWVTNVPADSIVKRLFRMAPSACQCCLPPRGIFSWLPGGPYHLHTELSIAKRCLRADDVGLMG